MKIQDAWKVAKVFKINAIGQNVQMSISTVICKSPLLSLIM